MALEWLILVPTKIERDLLALSNCEKYRVELCGFGLVGAAINSIQLVSDLEPHNIIHAGLAGRYNHQVEIGRAYEFEKISCHGVGIGSGDDFRSFQNLGWSPFPHNNNLNGTICLPLHSDETAGQLVSVASATVNRQDRVSVLQSYPGAVAEDMESFSVAAACAVLGRSPIVIRGISNDVGDRQKSNWEIEAAMSSVSNMVAKIIQE